MTVVARGAQGECDANDLPADATALALNVTTVEATLPTFITMWPGGARPNASSLNPAPGQPPTPNAVTVPVSATGTFNAFNLQGSVHIIIDVVGYYTDHNHDDRYALADPDSVRPHLGYAVPDDTDTWSISQGGWSRSSGAEGCLAVPVETAAGRIVTNLTMRYFSENPVSLEVFMTSLISEPRVVDSEADVFSRHIIRNVALPASGGDTIAEAVVTDDVTLIPELSPGGLTNGDNTATIQLCSGDSMQLFAIEVNYAPRS